MGKPVRIADLAKRMISLMELTMRDDANPEGRHRNRLHRSAAGGKLFEELLIGTNVTGTKALGDHARDGAFAAVASGTAGARRRCRWRWQAALRLRRRARWRCCLNNTVDAYKPNWRHPESGVGSQGGAGAHAELKKCHGASDPTYAHQTRLPARPVRSLIRSDLLAANSLSCAKASCGWPAEPLTVYLSADVGHQQTARCPSTTSR